MKNIRNVFLLLFAFNLLLASSSHLLGGDIYFSDGNTIRRVTTNNSGDVEELFTDSRADEITTIKIDVDRGKIYWVNHWVVSDIDPVRNGGELKRADLNGDNEEILYSKVGLGVGFWGLISPIGGFALDLSHDKIFWGTHGMAGRIYKANLDGSDRKSLAFADSGGLDVSDNTIYWGEGNVINRADLDCLSFGVIENYFACIESKLPIETGSVYDSPIVIDADNKKLYAFDGAENRIVRYDSFVHEGINDEFEVLVSDVERDEMSIGIAIDPEAEKMYWTKPVSGKIQRAKIPTLRIFLLLR